MLNQKKLQSILPVGDFGHVLHFHKRIGSTNDEAKELAAHGAEHGTLIVAEEQTEGRGRAGRTWRTPAGSAIAMSLILRPEDTSPSQIGELTVLGALAVVQALEKLGVQAWIKWPNDVLVAGGKTAGVLVDGGWLGDQIQYVVIGIGINVHKDAIEASEQFDFPAECIQNELGREVDRLELIRQVLASLAELYDSLGSGDLIPVWERNLAYKGKMVTIQGEQMNSTGKLVGITEHGQLRLQLFTGEVLKIGVGGQQLRPVDRS